MQTLTVELEDRSYPISIGAGLLRQQSLLQAAVPANDILLVSNTTVAPLYAKTVTSALADRRIVEVILPDGEQHKSLATAGRVFDVLVANRFGRDALVLALGGGVIGDLAGFVAACYQRGIDFVQMPTTLLAQVDSSVGGKTAVNHPGGKNLIGSFHQPREVLADTDVLATLPEREYQAGIAEVIKYGLICDRAFFEWLEQNIEALVRRDGSRAGARDLPFLPDQGADRRARRARARRARAVESRAHLRPRHRGGDRLHRMAPRGSGRCRIAHGRQHVAKTRARSRLPMYRALRRSCSERACARRRRASGPPAPSDT